ncbi:sialate O-acetylesterase [Echinicola marina]|uniref:sialate O-acetylesterase n=1 Tax=Echinicola marina TaxID=2859768 RepID=UPI001CF6B3F2|nr:sialate O-acetylesterase [Echinicola marina]UCS93366.1 sialate O-acetylesterase [Echinicola marina]
MNKQFNLYIIICFLLLVSLQAKGQELSFADPLGDHMVVQQNKLLKVWGNAEPGAIVRITADWASSPVEVVADSFGKFLGILPVPRVKRGDFSSHWLRISSNKTSVQLDDILIGDVWICSGQSNMQFGMDEAVNAEEEIKKANHPNLRLFYAGLNFSNVPIDDINGEWKSCDSSAVRKFSAVAYYFGSKLHEDLDIPVGVIFTGIGASAAQAYVPREVLQADSVLNGVYLQPYLQSDKSKEKIDGGFSFEKVTRPYLLYNAIIHPFKNLSISGFCWYQGESNRHERESYRLLTQSMIKSWRAAFSQGELPFYMVQVAPFFYDIEDPKMADYAFFREAQEEVTALGNTEMVVTMDVGEAKDLHPKNKKPIGERLARTALNRYYGELQVDYQGPQLMDVEYDKGKAVVSFKTESIKSGLQTNDGMPPKFFQVAGADQVFYPAQAVIEGNQVVLSSKEVKKPVAVRYAFTNYPVTNLENKAGIPAVPFRTDNWQEPDWK